MIYSHLITVTGWTWEYIDMNMTLPRLYSLTQYWRDNPPLHILIGAFLGVKPSGKSLKNKEPDLAELIAELGMSNPKAE